MEYTHFMDSLNKFDRNNNIRNSQMKSALHKFKTENQNSSLVRQRKENLEKANEIFEDTNKNEEEMR